MAKKKLPIEKHFSITEDKDGLIMFKTNGFTTFELQGLLVLHAAYLKEKYLNENRNNTNIKN